jgi:hypothetical protein
MCCVDAELRIKEALDRGVAMSTGGREAQETVLASRVCHDVELLVEILKLFEERRAVSEQYVVIRHAVHDEQRTA